LAEEYIPRVWEACERHLINEIRDGNQLLSPLEGFQFLVNAKNMKDRLFTLDSITEVMSIYKYKVHDPIKMAHL